jgi:hypothetical protein
VPEAVVLDGLVQIGGVLDVLRSVAVHETVDDPVHDDEDRHLQEHREAPAERVDRVLLVEGHHRLVESLAIALVLVLELLDLRLQALQRQHRAGALHRERRQHDHHREREHRDGEDVAVGEAEVEGEQPRERVKHGWSSFRDGIDAVATPWVATAEAAGGQPAAAQGTMALDGFEGVVRATGPVTTRGGATGPDALVPADGKGHQARGRTHGATACRASTTIAFNSP